MKPISKIIMSALLAGSILIGCSISGEEISGMVEEKVKEEASKALQKKLDQLNENVEAATEITYPSISSEGFEQIPVKLATPVDGDTARIFLKGADKLGAKIGKDGSVAVRYLLIDTPETVDPRLKGPQPFGKEASERNQQLLESGNITIEFDIGEKVDRYGRLLAYVYVDGISIQETLVSEGLARVAYVYPPNTRHLDTYDKAQEKARKAGDGIWSIENYATDKGFKE